MNDGARLNRVWAELMVEELVRCGVNVFCLAPGLRSAPLALAVAAHEKTTTVVHYDERGTAFFALGYGRATGRAAVWITTSGTAVGHGLPAVIEASNDRVPMLLLTADRPAELRGTGANQAIDQVGIFGDHVRWEVDLPAPSAAITPFYVLTTMDQACYQSQRTPRGPVHINCMFREPLVGLSGDASDYAEPTLAWQGRSDPYTRYGDPGPRTADVSEICPLLAGVEKGLVIAGRLRKVAEAQAALRLSKGLGWPILPDLVSQLRLGYGCATNLIGGFDRLLVSEKFASEHAPGAVLHLGGGCVSKNLRSYLCRHRPNPYVVVAAGPERMDPDHIVSHHLEADIEAFCEAAARLLPPRRETNWARSWKEHYDAAERRTESALGEAGSLSEPYVARVITRLLPEQHAVFVSSSMPVRDLDLFAAADGVPAPLAANRGASGIDGTIATAAGFAAGLAVPVTVVIGDLALLHDLNSLAFAARFRLIIVVMNNNGGGIFHFIPGATEEQGFETVFGAPHGFGFQDAAHMFDLNYVRPTTRQGFVEAYSRACARGGGALIEIRTNRKENHALHEELRRMAPDA